MAERPGANGRRVPSLTHVRIALLVWIHAVGAAQEARIESLTPRGDQIQIAWHGLAGWDHAIQRAPSLPAAQWTEVFFSPRAGELNEATLALPAGQTAGFYRVVCTPPGGAQGPHLFFTDLESGPNTGGQDDMGVFVTIYGEGFGAERGDPFVTVGGGQIARYLVWGQNNAARQMDMIVVQLGPAATSGDIRVIVNTLPSNPLPFTVRPGAIYFFAPDTPNANEANPGTYAEPFQTVYRPRAVMQAGDTVYIQGGRIDTLDTDDEGAADWDTTLLLDDGAGAVSGAPGRPVAYLGYPRQLDPGIRTQQPSDRRGRQRRHGGHRHGPHLQQSHRTGGRGRPAGE